MLNTQTADSTFELFYNFCGQFNAQLEKDYKKAKMNNLGVSFPQFCIITFANLMEDSNKPVKRTKKK